MNETPELQTLAINTIRFLSADAVQQAKSGHPGLPMGAAPWLIPSGPATCATTRPTRTGPTATASFSPVGMAPCCCTPAPPDRL